MEEIVRFVECWRQSFAFLRVSELCEQFGISRKTGLQTSGAPTRLMDSKGFNNHKHLQRKNKCKLLNSV